MKANIKVEIPKGFKLVKRGRTIKKGDFVLWTAGRVRDWEEVLEFD